MKKLRINYDLYSDIIACPEYIAKNLKCYLEGMYDWIQESAEAEEFRRMDENGEVHYYIDTQTILKYLNVRIIKEDEEKAYLVKHKALWFERPKYYVYF